VVELLPHYAKLLAQLDQQHGTKELATSTAIQLLGALRMFLRTNQQALQGSSVDYAAMLSSISAAHDKYSQLHRFQENPKGGNHPSGAQGHTASTSTAATAGAGAATAATGSAAAVPRDAAAMVGGAAPTQGAAAAAAWSAHGLTFAQLHQWLPGSSSSNGFTVLWQLAQSMSGTTEFSAVAPVLLTYTSPLQLASCRHAAIAGSAVEHRTISNTLRGLQQLLQQPVIDAVLGAAVRQQRLHWVSLIYSELQASAGAAGLAGVAVPADPAQGRTASMAASAGSAAAAAVAASAAAGAAAVGVAAQGTTSAQLLATGLQSGGSSTQPPNTNIAGRKRTSAAAFASGSDAAAAQDSSTAAAPAAAPLPSAQKPHTLAGSTSRAETNPAEAVTAAAAKVPETSLAVTAAQAATRADAASAAAARPIGSVPASPGGAAAAAGFASRATFAQLCPQVGGSSSSSGLGVLRGLVQNTPGITADSAVAPVLLMYTSPELLADFRRNASVGELTDCGAIIQTLEGLQQLLQQPELDVVLGAAVRQQRLADVSLTLQELQASGLQAGGSSSQVHDAASRGVGVGRSGDFTASLQGVGALNADRQAPPVDTSLPGNSPQLPASAFPVQHTERANDSQQQLVDDDCAGTVQVMMMDDVIGSDPQPVAQQGGALPPPAPGPTASTSAADDNGGPNLTGRSISMADLLQQLQSEASLGTGCVNSCIRQLESRVACLSGVGVDAIPVSLLLTNHIAEVGDRAQQCISAGDAGKQGPARAGVRAECFAVMQEVEGLLQLSGQPVLLQLLGDQGLEELTKGLSRCKQQLGDKLMSLNVLCL
jgi:hypothetical protein